MHTYRQYDYKIHTPDAQFFLCDDGAQFDPSGMFAGSPPGLIVTSAEGVVAVRTIPGACVRVLVEVRRPASAGKEDGLTVLSECMLDVPSGRIVVAGSTDFHPDAGRIPLVPGLYHALILYGSLDTIYGGIRPTQNHYKVILWHA